MKLSVRHRTHYGYSATASQSLNQICLLPRDTTSQRCLQASVVVTPVPNAIDRRIDQYGNSVATFNLNAAHTECDIIVTSLVQTFSRPSIETESLSVEANYKALSRLHDRDSLMARDCLLSSPSIPMDNSVDRIIEELPIGKMTVLEYGSKLMSHIFTTFSYESGFSTLVTPLTEIIAARKGVCQDFAHLAIAVLRRQKVPARYVSGYLETLPPPGETKLQGADASHAWYSVFSANDGWYDFDPTNNKRPDQQYITTAWGRDYSDVVPIKGVVYGGGAHRLTVEVDVNRTEAPPLLVEQV
ncbi:hypothetical protein AB833_27700 [Chromatiales bacterium (ex Bugula neritina AB1)]|nr:hypothetical protein AB833_27700 [Chromatiales bacterium (ex Bugula neritina AB1)]